MTEKSEGDWRAGLYRGNEDGACGVGFEARHFSPRSPRVARRAIDFLEFLAHLDGTHPSSRTDSIMGRAVQAGQTPTKHFEIREGTVMR